MHRECENHIAHIVFFNLKAPTDESRQALVDSCYEHLTGHNGVLYFGAGQRAPEFNRPVNDDQFDVALHVVFESLAAHDAYQESPRHHAFLNQNKESWAAVRVFDSWV